MYEEMTNAYESGDEDKIAEVLEKWKGENNG